MFVFLIYVFVGVDTKDIMEVLAADLRAHIFGLHLILKYIQVDGQEKIVDLPSSSGRRIYVSLFCFSLLSSNFKGHV
jgi:hypothetical protein